jgi:putative DNA methylase
MVGVSCGTGERSLTGRMAAKRKLIEVALPLEKINEQSAREKSIRHGHPSTLHLWWARRPLAACRAVLFAQLVDDPSSHPEKFPTEQAQKAERERLFDIIERFVDWDNVNDEALLTDARQEILRSTGPKPPPILDPFCGGGSIPLEAQRFGLEAHASDLNPVAVLITKALIEIPPRFAGRPPVHPNGQKQIVEGGYRGAQGLAEDIRYYGEWMRNEAEKRIGDLYPKAKLPPESGGGEATVIAWLWARTVASPNPACGGAHVPLVRSFWLSSKTGKQAWVEPVVDRASNTYRFEVRTGIGRPQEGTVNRHGGTCLLSGVPMPFEYIRSEGQAGGIGARLMAIVAEGPSGRVYIAPIREHEVVAKAASPAWKPEADLEGKAAVNVPLYGLTRQCDLFIPRQLVALTTFSNLVMEARAKVLEDALRAGMAEDGKGLEDGGDAAKPYADAVAVYLAFAVDRAVDAWSSLASWRTSAEATRGTFARQALPMVWDYAEANPFSGSCGNWADASVEWIAQVVEELPCSAEGTAKQFDATQSVNGITSPVISTDPPYYDNIAYADLSDFFYVWLRRSLGKVLPSLFSTVLVPKAQELVATPYRFGGDAAKAKAFFERGLAEAFGKIRAAQNPDFPITVYYAFKQTETDGEDEEGRPSQVTSTGWETMLEALISTGFMVTGTWPMRTERLSRPVASDANALASSIVLVCRQRPADAPVTTRRDFTSSLKRDMPGALRTLQQGYIAPVDLAQAAIGPGMAVFSRYAKVIEADGSPMRVRTALALINQVLDEYLTEQEGDYDPDTRWAVGWFEQYGMTEGPFGVAETLSKAKNTSVQGLQQDGMLSAVRGKVRLLKGEEMAAGWDPAADRRLTVWEAVQHLVREHQVGGDRAAAVLLRKLGPLAETARDLAYRLYVICERKGWASEGYLYNALVAAWPEIVKEADRMQAGPRQSRPLM